MKDKDDRDPWDIVNKALDDNRKYLGMIDNIFNSKGFWRAWLAIEVAWIVIALLGVAVSIAILIWLMTL